MNTTKEIEKLINNYFEGIYYGNFVTLKTCFYENTLILGNIKDTYHVNSVKDYLEKVKKRQSPKELNEVFKMRILKIDVMDKIAMAKLQVPMLGYNYYDYLSLFKINGQWKIVNKTFIHIE